MRLAYTAGDAVFSPNCHDMVALGAVRVGKVTQFSKGRSVYYREPAGSFFEIERPDEDAT